MNILFICDEYPPGPHGGIGTMVQVLGRELVKQGHQVFVAGLYSYRYGGKDYEEDQGVKVWRFRYGLNAGPRPKSKVYTLLEKLPAPVRSLLNGKKAFKRFISFINGLIEEERIHVIEIQDWNTFTFFIGFEIKWPVFPVPLILKSNGSYTYFADEAHEPINPKKNHTDKLLYGRADAISAVSRYTADRDKILFNLTSEIRIHYNSVEFTKNLPFTKRVSDRLIFTGSLLPKKGINQLLKAWNLVHKKLPDATLIIYGKGRTKALIKLLDQAAANTVRFKGHVSREELHQELSKATAAIFPSYSECFSFAPLEAMAAGCPVINTSRSSGKELVTDYENGSLVDPDNITQIAERIMELLTDKELQKKYSENGAETIRKYFNITKSAHEHVEYYQQVSSAFQTDIR